MKKHLFIFLSVFIVSSLDAQETLLTYEISLTNNRNEKVADAPVSVSLGDLNVPFDVRSARVTDGTSELPSQLDDLDKDGMADELAFVADVDAQSTKTLRVQLSPQASDKQYPARVFAEMLLRGDKGKHQPITSLTVLGNSDVYNLLHHHGPAFESELVAYRIYFDRKQTVDIYGKFKKGLEVEESQFYPTDEQLARGFGDDVLLVGGSGGLGTLKGWNGTKATHIEPVATRTESVLATGPVRTVVDIDVDKWQYQGSELGMKVRYILYAGHRDCEVQVSFDKPLQDEVFCVGVQNIVGSESYSDGDGLVACWGTHWPVNDTVKYAKETVGLAMSAPREIVRGQQDDKVNYLYQVGNAGKKGFTYYISFTSMKETFGYKSREEWFAHVRKWKQGLQEPVRVEWKEEYPALKYAIDILESEMIRCPESWQLDFQERLKWDYCHGLELQAFLQLYERTGNKKYFDYALAYADTMIHNDGSITAYKLSDYNIDRVNSGKMLFKLYDYTRQEKIRKAIDLLRSQLDTHPRNDDGGFWHKKIYPHQVWLDGVYMGTPYLAEYASRNNRPQDFADAINQITMAARHTYDPSNGLYRHACDVSREMFWADPVTGQSKHSWGRAMGWYAMAIVDALDFIPENQPGREDVLAILGNIGTQLKRIQDKKTGLWYQVLDKSGARGNYLESSCSAMFIYTLFKAVRMGYLDASYRDIAEKAFKGFIREFVEYDKDGLMNITRACAVAGLGGKENRSGTFEYYINEQIRANDPKVIGPFVMAVLEREKVGVL